MTCAVCGARSLAGLQVCGTCDRRLTELLRAIPGLLRELEVTRCRQDRIGSGSAGGKSSVRPLPFNEQASDVIYQLRSVCLLWSGLLDPAVARLDPRVVELIADLDAVVRRARQVIDRPADKVFCGPCNEGDCREDLYAKPGKAVVVCKLCQAEYDVKDRREWMLAAIHDQEADAGLMSSILTSLGHKIHSSTIRRYGTDGLLNVVSRDAKGTAQYRIGEVLDIFYSKKSRQGKKKMAQTS